MRRAEALQVRNLVFDPKANPVTLREALLLARALCRMSEQPDAESLDLLAITQAANGLFEDAARTCLRGIERADAGGQADLAAQMRRRLELYKQKRPYTQASLAG
jgi:hypothetical protein